MLGKVITQVTRVLTVKLFFNWNKDLPELCTGTNQLVFFSSCNPMQTLIFAELKMHSLTMINFSMESNYLGMPGLCYWVKVPSALNNLGNKALG